MSDLRGDFTTRVNRLTRKHATLARGYSASMRGDGLIVVKPRRLQFRFPLRGFVLLMAFFMIFKGFMLAHLGDDAYYQRVGALQQGSVFEKAGAIVMGIDPVSRGFADIMRPYIQ